MLQRKTTTKKTIKLWYCVRYYQAVAPDLVWNGRSWPMGKLRTPKFQQQLAREHQEHCIPGRDTEDVKATGPNAGSWTKEQKSRWDDGSQRGLAGNELGRPGPGPAALCSSARAFYFPCKRSPRGKWAVITRVWLCVVLGTEGTWVTIAQGDYCSHYTHDVPFYALCPSTLFGVYVPIFPNNLHIYTSDSWGVGCVL